MEQYPSSMNNELTSQKPNRLKALAFLKVGLFELGFAAAALFLLFGTLNYFNILSVSDAFPNQFNWLPRQTDKLNTPPSPTNFTPNTFTYDTAKAQTLLTQYIKETIKPEFLPEKIEVKQGLSSEGNLGSIKYEFGSFLKTDKLIISTNFVYKENSSIPNAYGIFVQPENASQAAATASLANSLLSAYFISPYSISNCQQKGTTSYCENFQSLNDGGKGYGIMFIPEGASKMALKVFSCFIPKDSQYYKKSESCITP